MESTASTAANTAPEDIWDQARRYVEESKSQPDVRKDNGGELLSKDDNQLTGDSTYSAINLNRKRALISPNLNVTSTSFSAELGSFYNKDDSRISSAHLRSSFNNKLNVSLSFNPTTLECKNCSTNRHMVFDQGGVEGGGAARVFVLSDQNFPPVLPTVSGGCISVVRVENGSLWELATTFISLAAKGTVTVGSIVILSSATHLSDVGTAGYAEDLVRAARHLHSTFQGKICVRLGCPLLLNGTNDPALIRSVFEISSWIDSVRNKEEGFPDSVFKLVLLSLRNLGSGGSQPPYRLKLRLPVSLQTFEKQTWASDGWVDIPNAIKPMDKQTEKQIIEALVAELNLKFPVHLDPSPETEPQPGQAMEESKKELLVIAIGASHAARLAEALGGAGYRVERVITPSWRPTAAEMKKAAEDLSAVTSSYAAFEIVLIFQHLDCAAFYAQSEDGVLQPATRDSAGKYHIIGELQLAPRESFLSFLKTCLPLLRAGGSLPKLLLSPLPRYWLQSCCPDNRHITNKEDPDFEDTVFSGVDKLRRICKDFVHLNNISNTHVYNTFQLLGDKKGSRSTGATLREEVSELWGTDPVHPSEACYNKIAYEVTQMLSSEKQPPTAAEKQLPQGPRWLEANEDHQVGPSFYNHRRGGHGGRRGHGRGRGSAGGGGRWPHVRSFPY